MNHPAANFDKASLNDDGAMYMPISALNSYCSDWIFKARVLKKPPVRNYKNQRGEGQILNIDLIDRDGTMIQGTFFNKEVENWADKL